MATIPSLKPENFSFIPLLSVFLTTHSGIFQSTMAKK